MSLCSHSPHLSLHQCYSAHVGYVSVFIIRSRKEKDTLLHCPLYTVICSDEFWWSSRVNPLILCSHLLYLGDLPFLFLVGWRMGSVFSGLHFCNTVLLEKTLGWLLSYSPDCAIGRPVCFPLLLLEVQLSVELQVAFLRRTAFLPAAHQVIFCFVFQYFGYAISVCGTPSAYLSWRSLRF